jgi:hypothetical protein
MEVLTEESLKEGMDLMLIDGERPHPTSNA